ncbi:MAG: hypothetical protein E7048_04595 [Lentisphaerae bacterium]|nr:hypothetical protein [Lentisphaerota bacterium]
MEQMTVISGRGEHIDLSLPGTADWHAVETVCRKIIEMPSVSAREKIIGLFRHFFPEHYREALERISGADALKLASAFVLLSQKSKAGVFTLSPGRGREENSFSVSCDVEMLPEKCEFSLSDEENKSFTFRSSAKIPEGQGAQNVEWRGGLPTEKESFCIRNTPRNSNSFAAVDLEVKDDLQGEGNFYSVAELPGNGYAPAVGNDFSTAAGSQTITGEVILAAYRFKWTLEYAASLPLELLRRCLEVAGEKRTFPAAAIPEELYSPEEIRRAAERAAEAVKHLKKESH